MSQTETTLLEKQDSTDDWGDFSTVIHQLEQQEQDNTYDSVELTESNQTENKSDAVTSLLDVVFTLTEQATAVISGVEFEFDEKGKKAVIDAAVPVFDKHNATLMSAFGDYIEEATLFVAVLGLVYASRKRIELQLREQEAGNEKDNAPDTP